MANISAYLAFDIDWFDLNFFIRNLAQDGEQFDDDIGISLGLDYDDAFHLVTDTDALSVYGDDFAYNAGGKMVNGQITEMVYWVPDSGTVGYLGAYTVTGLDLTMRDYYDASHTFSIEDDMAIVRAQFSGNDKFDLSNNDDHAMGFSGRDLIVGNDGNDKLEGNGGKDVLKGGNGLDKLFGGTQSDKLYGGKHADKLYGNKGGDSIFGGKGRDVIVGGVGNDKLNGGFGDDKFVFATGDGLDVIRDFDARGASHDYVDLSDLVKITTWWDLKTNHMTQSGDDVLIDGRNGDAIVLQNVDLADLDKGDFIF